MTKRQAGWVLAVLATAGTARAQTGPSEEQHRRGMALRAAGQNAEAAEVFRAIYAQTREPRALARQGLAEAAAEQWVHADEHLRAALGFATDAWINANRQNLARDLGVIEGHLGTIEVVAPVSGAELRVDDVVRGTLPLSAPLRVLAGTAHLELRAEGYLPLTREVTVAPGVTATQRIELAPQRAVVAVVTPPVVTPPVVTPPVVRPPTVRPPDPIVVRTPPVAPTPHPRGSNTRVALGVTGLALGGAGLVLGVVGLVLRNGNATDFGAVDARGNHCALTDSGTVVTPTAAGFTTDCNGLYSAGSTMQSLSIAGFVAGGVFAAAGTVLLVTAPSARERVGLSLRCGVGPGDVGVACGGTF